MSKKDKKIEIQMADAQIALDGQQVPGVELVIGKRVIGQLIELDGKFATVSDGRVTSFYKTQELAVTSIIEAYNLNR